MIRAQPPLEHLTGLPIQRTRRPPIVRAHPNRHSYAEPSLGPPHICGSTGQDPIPVGNPRSHASEAPASPYRLEGVDWAAVQRR